MEKIGILTKTVEAKESTQIAQLREQIELEVLASFEKNGENDTAEGYDNTKLHIGDFINYDAGIWTEEEINNIKTGEKGKEVTANTNFFAVNTDRVAWNKLSTWDIAIQQAIGVRVLVKLSADIKISEKPIGTKTVTIRNNRQTYNIWGIE